MELIANIIKEGKQHDGLRAQIHEHVNKSDLINEVLNQCLFYRDNKTKQITIKKEKGETEQPKYAVKCTTKTTRIAAYKIINEFNKYLEPHEMVEFLQETLYPLIENVERPQKWRHSPSTKGRSMERVGINNPGCVCYMISML